MGANAGVEKQVRAFIALALPAEIKDSVGRLQDGLKTRESDVKWVPAANFHFTLNSWGMSQH